MIKAIAIDDEPVALQIIEKFAQKVPFLELKASFLNALEAVEYLNQQPHDLLFLDIKMPDITGMEFLASLSSPPSVIFTTAYSEFAVQSYELEAIDYLLKPFSFSRFLKACNRALPIIERHAKNSDSILLKTGYEKVRVQVEEILFVESCGNYVQFVLKDQKVMTRMPMLEVEKILPKVQFPRVHKSYIVAIDKVSRIQRHQLCLDDEVVPIGKNYAKNLPDQ
ncbi:LytTR family DNA-binding domain-containing protein [Catalinimonas sp. 4WD22]|uniref:LytR/AlgR family response regulator transcription factor n=1 Tax=Catalinimonas locisalis TaxID=3133978 RepID=UPI003100EDCD